jgi:hypothetical protein
MDNFKAAVKRHYHGAIYRFALFGRLQGLEAAAPSALSSPSLSPQTPNPRLLHPARQISGVRQTSSRFGDRLLPPCLTPPLGKLQPTPGAREAGGRKILRGTDVKLKLLSRSSSPSHPPSSSLVLPHPPPPSAANHRHLFILAYLGAAL